MATTPPLTMSGELNEGVVGGAVKACAILARLGDNPLLVATANAVPAHPGEAGGQRWVKPGVNINYLRPRGNKGGGGKRREWWEEVHCSRCGEVAVASLPADARLPWGEQGLGGLRHVPLPVPNWAGAGTAGAERQLCPVSTLLRIQPWLLLPVCSSPGLG